MSSSLPPPVTCRAGCAIVTITPPVGVSLAGYFHDRISESVRDDLCAHALVLEHVCERIALVSCDLICIDGEVADPAKALIQEQTGIPPERVLICATHTHTGPEIRKTAVVPRMDEWVETLPAKIAQAVGEAAEGMFAATLRPNRTCAEGLSWNRLWRVKDGREVFGRPADAIGPAGPIDPEVVTLGVVDEQNRLRALIASFALHVDVIGGGGAKAISADWPGEFKRAIQGVYGGDVVTVFLQGTSGDINHWPHVATHLPTGGPQKSMQIGRALAGAAMYAAERAEPLSDLKLDGALEVIQIPYYTRDEKLLAEVAELKKQEKLGDFERFLVKRTEEWSYDGKSVDTPIQCLRIGDIAIVALPAEIFVKIGMEIKHFSPAAYTMVVELANGRVTNYVPTTDQAERGAYGAKPILSRWLCSDAGRRMADTAQVMLRRMWG
jgi:neutral ceramidase